MIYSLVLVEPLCPRKKHDQTGFWCIHITLLVSGADPRLKFG